MQYITKANTTYAGKPKVYICAHPEDIECHTPDIAKDIFARKTALFGTATIIMSVVPMNILPSCRKCSYLFFPSRRDC